MESPWRIVLVGLIVTAGLCACTGRAVMSTPTVTAVVPLSPTASDPRPPIGPGVRDIVVTTQLWWPIEGEGRVNGWQPTLSPDGRYVAWLSDFGHLMLTDTEAGTTHTVFPNIAGT